MISLNFIGIYNPGVETGSKPLTPRHFDLVIFTNLAYPMMREPKTDPIPAPDPATPTVAAPAPMNLAAESMSLLAEII